MPDAEFLFEGHHSGMGAIPYPGGIAFRVWAPHANRVSIVGSFNEWKPDRSPMNSEGNGYWYGEVSGAKFGDEYRFHIVNGEQELSRIDPYAKQVTNSVGNAVVADSAFDWAVPEFHLPPWNELIIYELHIGTFNDYKGGKPGTFQDAIAKIGHLKTLGINCVQIMPTAEFAGDFSWGYNPAHIFAVESAYGGPKAFKAFVDACHKNGIGVILDVVYNHFGPSDLHLWQFDGWSENNGGGIYFYNDWRSETLWGNTRPDYGRPEVRQFIRDNALYWIEEFHIDGLRFDMTLYIRTVKPGEDLPDGWSLTQRINQEIRNRFPGKITIAEDLQNNEWLTKDVEHGGAGFGAQWDANFVHPIREAVIASDDGHRSMDKVRQSLTFRYNGDPFERLIFSESHDEVANGKQRIPSEINTSDPRNFFAQKRSTLAAGLVCTAPGIPMLFQGQEFLEGGWFQDTVPLDWEMKDDFQGIVRLYRDLISLRLNKKGFSRGLCGRHIDVFHVNDNDNMLAFRRWDKGGPGDDVVVVVNLSAKSWDDYIVGYPAARLWKLRLNSASKTYSKAFSNHPSGDVTAKPGSYDGQPAHAHITIAPYTMLIYS